MSAPRGSLCRTGFACARRPCGWSASTRPGASPRRRRNGRRSWECPTCPLTSLPGPERPGSRHRAGANLVTDVQRESQCRMHLLMNLVSARPSTSGASPQAPSALRIQPRRTKLRLIGSDLHTSFRDLEFLSRFARELPFADADRLGAMGHSWGATAVLHWAALPDSSLRAFVTLDSGWEYIAVEDSGAEPLVFHMKTNKGNIRAAALRFASTERKANF